MGILYANASSVHRLAYTVTSLEKWACDDIASRVWLAVQLKVFVLAEGYGMKVPEIAELLGGTATKQSVRDALRHARRKLRSERVGLRLGVVADE